MAIERCSRCKRMVDLDWHCEDIIYLGDTEAVCDRCATSEEWEENEE